jgi:predicted  nucleic acid-binding Zn-ribbon protein
LATGTHTWSISIFVQSKTLVSNHTNLIKVNEEKIFHLNEDLSSETDPAVIKKIQGEITELQTQNTELSSAIVDSREQIGSGETLTFSVQ